MCADAATTLDYAPPAARPTVMPAGAVVLLSLAIVGLSSLLLRGRPALRGVLWMNGATAAVGSLLVLIWPPDFSFDAGGIFSAPYIPLLAVSVVLGLKDRRNLVARGLPQAAARWLWLTLFWAVVLLASFGLVSAAAWTAICIGFGGPEPLLIGIAAGIVLAAILLLVLVVHTLCAPRQA